MKYKIEIVDPTYFVHIRKVFDNQEDKDAFLNNLYQQDTLLPSLRQEALTMRLFFFEFDDWHLLSSEVLYRR